MKVVVSAPLLNVALILGHVYFGAGWALGPDRLMSSGSFTVARQVLDQQAWGWLILAGAALSLASPFLPATGAALCRAAAAGPLLLMAAVLATADVAGASQGWGGPLLFLTPCLLHAALVHARLSHRRGAARA